MWGVSNGFPFEKFRREGDSNWLKSPAYKKEEGDTKRGERGNTNGSGVGGAASGAASGAATSSGTTYSGGA